MKENSLSVKCTVVLTIMLMGAYRLKAQEQTSKIQMPTPVIEMSADYPGGIDKFLQYVSGSLKYREVEHLLGITGKVHVSFVVDSTGRLTDIKPTSNIGSGCEEEVVDIISHSGRWKQGMQNGRPINIKMAIPVTFNIPKDNIIMKELRQGKDGYLFQIKDTIYDIDKAAVLLGETFSPTQIEITNAYTGDIKVQGKEQVWLVKIKS